MYTYDVLALRSAEFAYGVAYKQLVDFLGVFMDILAYK